MKRIVASLLLLANLTSAQSWGPLLDTQNQMLNQQNSMLTVLTTDDIVTLFGNPILPLATGSRQQVRNTAILSTHEVWTGTADGNRLLTMRGGEFSIPVVTGGQLIAIPHGLGYEPKFAQVVVLSPAGFSYTQTKTSTYIILTMPNQITLPNTFKGTWLAR